MLIILSYYQVIMNLKQHNIIQNEMISMKKIISNEFLKN